MKRLLSTSYSAGVFNFAMLFLRIGMGSLLLSHGYDKLVHFATYKSKFINFLGMGSGLSLSLVIFAEFFCSLFLIVGLFSRLVAIPIVIAMFMAVWKSHHFDFFGAGEKATLFLIGFITILLLGPGKASVDGMVGK
ncbi:MAG TPA: DoxX family protein [Flavitalea sp.]|nr:DoxX family protein [Flavitalea sp.]